LPAGKKTKRYFRLIFSRKFLPDICCAIGAILAASNLLFNNFKEDIKKFNSVVKNSGTLSQSLLAGNFTT
jgi:hypothetical protein